MVTVALQGDQGKPRPALIIQADLFSDLPSVTILPITGTLVEASLLRIDVAPTTQNGLKVPSQVMVDKVQTPSRTKIGRVVGHLEAPTMARVAQALALHLGLA